MADQQPDRFPPAAEPPSNDRAESTPADRTQADRAPTDRPQTGTNPPGAPAPHTEPVVSRWTGSAAIPPPTPHRRWWQLHARQAAPPARLTAGRATGGPAAPLDPTRAEVTPREPWPLNPTRAVVTYREPRPLNPTATLPDPDDVAAALAAAPGSDREPQPQRSYQDWENTPPVAPWAEHDTLPPVTLPPVAPPPLAPPPLGTPGAGPPGPGAPGPGAPGAGSPGPAPSWRRRLFTRPRASARGTHGHPATTI
jgi:hypothetical protein